MIRLAPVLSLLLSALLCSCGDFSAGASASGGFGATQGGVQDMRHARELIAQNIVPRPEAFVVEGMFSEHELGLAGPACTEVLCLRAALGIAPDVLGEQAAWLQIGMSSTVNPETFERRSTTLVMAVDVSGSMGFSYGENTLALPGEMTRQLLHKLNAELGANDQIAIVTYGGGAHTVLPLTNGAEHEAAFEVIEALDADGVTNMEEGLRLAYEVAEQAVGETDEVRVMLFTDARPNVGATGQNAFQLMAAQGADEGVGLTVFGLGLGLGGELMKAMSELRGGNAYSIMSDEEVATVMAEDWPWMASPIAYDLEMSPTITGTFDVAGRFGFPGSDDADLSLHVPTVFLSKRKGALLAKLSGEGDMAELRVDSTITYRTNEGTVIEQEVVSAYGGQALDSRGQYFQQSNVAKTTALALLTSGMAEAVELYGNDQPRSLEKLREVQARFLADISDLDDPALDREVQLAADLLALMELQADQDLSGPY